MAESPQLVSTEAWNYIVFDQRTYYEIREHTVICCGKNIISEGSRWVGMDELKSILWHQSAKGIVTIRVPWRSAKFAIAEYLNLGIWRRETAKAAILQIAFSAKWKKVYRIFHVNRVLRFLCTHYTHTTRRHQPLLIKSRRLCRSLSKPTNRNVNSSAATVYIRVSIDLPWKKQREWIFRAKCTINTFFFW